MLAKATLIGRITKDLELRKTNNQKSVVSFSLACDVGYGENKQTSFIECVAWNTLAENLCTYQEKGNLIALQGNIQTRNYENKEGKKVYVTEVVAENIIYLPSKQASGQSNGIEQANTSQNGFVAQNGSNDVLNDFGISNNDFEGDLPF